jgi:outer membrane lipoprotein-sorting protein
MLQAERTLVLEGDQVTTVVRNGLDVSSEQHVLRDGSRAYRLDYLRPPRLAGETVVDNGQFLWHYQPSRNRLQISPSRIRRLGAGVPRVMKQVRQGTLTIQWLGQETVAGHACGIVQVQPHGSSGARRRFWIDLANGAQLKIEHQNASGQPQSVSYFTRVQYSPAFDRHAFDPPHPKSGVNIVPAEPKTPALSWNQVQAQAGFTVLPPAYLPPGFRFQSGSITKFHKRPLVGLRYANGLNVLSVFETPDAGAPRNPKPRQGIVIGWQNGLKIIVIGNLDAGEMNRVLSSVR